MEDHLLQNLHDGLTQANNRRGRHGGIGGVAGEAAQKNTHTFFGEDGASNPSSGLYANFVKGSTLTASKDVTCTVIKASGSDKDEEEASGAKRRDAKRKLKTRPVEGVSACEPTDCVEADAKPAKGKKVRAKCDSGFEPADADSVTSSSRAQSKRSSLVSVVLQGGRLSLREHLLAAMPRCRRFLLVGGCGTVDVLLHQDGEGRTVKRKKLSAAHLHGTCDVERNASENSLHSLSGIFHLLQPDSERPQLLEACFGVDDLFAGGRGLCEVWGFAFDKRGDPISP
ncbi:hypothetical protein Efla_006337 [Eimeria flavescens]